MTTLRQRSSVLGLLATSLVACSFSDQPLYAPPDAAALPPDTSKPVVTQPAAGSRALPVAGHAADWDDGGAPPLVDPDQDDSGPAAPPAAGGGAPPPVDPRCQTDCTSYVDIATRLNLMAADLAAQPDELTRRDIRYLDLSHYANAGHGERELALYRDALAYATNMLSSGPVVVAPQAIDPQQLLFRIRLGDYGWNATTWEQLVAAYPYAVSYEPSSRTFPIDDSALIKLREQTFTNVPYLQADWFFSHAVRPPLYHQLLGIPNDLRLLELQLGVDIDTDIAAERVSRAGFQESGPSHFNRVIERHALPNDRGVLWLTYDFAAGSGNSNVFTHPLDFVHTSSELLFSLANGLHGYMIVDGRGARLDKAPNASVQDVSASDLAIENGLSCMNCHAQIGVTTRYDEVHAAAALTPTDIATNESIREIYEDDATLDALFQQDRARYQAALSALRLAGFAEGNPRELDDAFFGLLSAKQVAGVLGITEQQLLAAINTAPGVFPAEALALRAPGSRIPRDRFEAQFEQLVTSLGLGVVVQP